MHFCWNFTLLYSKTGVNRGMHFFLIIVLKQKLWILVRTASKFGYSLEPPLYVDSRIRVCFSASVIAASVKHCRVIVLDILV